jgi:hypothetical protein
MKEVITGRLEITYDDILIHFKGTAVSLDSIFQDFNREIVKITIEKTDYEKES